MVLSVSDCLYMASELAKIFNEKYKTGRTENCILNKKKKKKKRTKGRREGKERK